MRVAIIADQHGTLPTIPDCDMLICSGDLTGGNPHGPRDNSDAKWRDWLRNEFSKWALGVGAWRIAVAGNHDTALENVEARNNGLFIGTIYLQDSSDFVGCGDQGFSIWGTPWVRQWDTLAFNLPPDKLKAKWDLISDDTDILVCHQPPLGYGDDGKGCLHLTERIRQIKPKLVTCGHIHEGRGVYDLDGTMVVNASGGFITVDL